MDRSKIDMNFNGIRATGMERRLYKRHLEALEFPAMKVDNHAPTLAVASYYNAARLQSERLRLTEIEMENRLLLKIINEIYRTHGKVDTSPPNLKKSTNYYERFLNNRLIEKQNLKMYKLLEKARPTFSKAQLDKDYKLALKTMMFQARHTEYYSSLLPELEKWDICPTDWMDRLCCNVNQRVQCFMDVGIDDARTSPNRLIKLGRMYMEIYRDYAPMAADNFLNFIKGYNGKSYKGTQFFRIRKSIGCIGGDVENNDGGGYYGIGGKCFPDENHVLRFNGPGVISTFTLFPNHNHSHFFISFRKLEALNGKFVVFGRLIKTLGALERIEECGTLSGTPKQKVVISNCGFIGKTNFPVAESRISSPRKQGSGVEVSSPGGPKEAVAVDKDETTKSILLTNPTTTGNTVTVPPNTLNTETYSK